MRALPLLAALLLLATPSAAGASGGLSLAAPTELASGGATTVPVSVRLTLQNVVCAREAEIPVTLSVLRASGARASLSTERLAIPIAPHSALARPWTGTAHATLAVEPLAAAGVVELLAAYRLPEGCTSLGGAASGEARHAMRVEQAGAAASEPFLPLPTRLPSSARGPDDGPLPLPVQAAIAGMCAGGLIVLAKRLRARAA